MKTRGKYKMRPIKKQKSTKPNIVVLSIGALAAFVPPILFFITSEPKIELSFDSTFWIFTGFFMAAAISYAFVSKDIWTIFSMAGSAWVMALYVAPTNFYRGMTGPLLVFVTGFETSILFVIFMGASALTGFAMSWIYKS